MYQSTRNNSLTAAPAEAVLRGIAPDGGLYMLKSFSELDFDWKATIGKSALGIAADVLFALLPDFGREGISLLTQKAYAGKFETDELVPLVPVGSDFVLELFRGPTSAFKDVALSVLPHLISEAKKKCGITDDIMILTATSGDTGKAALEGFCDVEGTRIIVFYPHGGVSEVQKAQMVSQKGRNVTVCAVKGNFDDAQTGVKNIFAEVSAKDLLHGSHCRLSSANSINIGRLAPQVMYYFKAYSDLVLRGEIRVGEKINFVVPTGNFGNILAGYFAKCMGLPVGKLVCASNANNVLTDFIQTGTYDKNRSFIKTVSPSMDILVSSNLERLLYLLCDCRAEEVASYMAQLKKTGVYTVSDTVLSRLRESFCAGFCDDEKTLASIRDTYEKNGYLADTHTAVALHVAKQFEKNGGNGLKTVVLSTASPYKFPVAVLSALGGAVGGDEFSVMERLHALTGVPIPAPLAGLKNAAVRHRDVIEKEEMLSYVLEKSVDAPKEKVTVRIPASSANLGPGFDTLGCAFALYNEITFSPAENGLSFSGCEERYCNEQNLVVVAYRAVLSALGLPQEGLHIDMKIEIPISRGLGSSAAYISAGALAANALHGSPLSREKLLEICTRIEGHPDNLAPMLFGGLTASFLHNGVPVTAKFTCSEKIRFVALIPDFELATAKARAVLPESISLRDAVFNISRVAVLIKAIENGDLSAVSAALDDRLHQPYREKLIDEYALVKKEATALGAFAFCISGAGPTCLALTDRADFADALAARLPAVCRNNWRVLPLAIDSEGARVIEES